MGIDIYAHWKGQTRRERKAQVMGWSVVHEHPLFTPRSASTGWKYCLFVDPFGWTQPNRASRTRRAAKDFKAGGIGAG